MKTPAPERAAGRKKLAAKGQALPGGSDPIPDVAYLKKAIRSVGRLDPAKRPALKALIRKRAGELGALNAPGVKGTWAFQGANAGRAIELVGPEGYSHGWKFEGTRAQLLSHLAEHHASGNVRGRRVGPKNPTIAQLHENHAEQHGVRSDLSHQHGPDGTVLFSTPQGWKPAAAKMANDGEAIDLATMTRRMPMVRGAADVQMARTAPGVISVMHKSSGMKVGTITPKGAGYGATHADGTATPASGSQQGALAGLIRHHNQMAAQKNAKARDAAGSPGSGIAMFRGYAGEQAALDLAGAMPSATSANSASDGPRMTSMGGGNASPAMAKLGLSPEGCKVYARLRKKGLDHGAALAFAKRAAAMHAKAAA